MGHSGSKNLCSHSLWHVLETTEYVALETTVQLNVSAPQRTHREREGLLEYFSTVQTVTLRKWLCTFTR